MQSLQKTEPPKSNTGVAIVPDTAKAPTKIGKTDVNERIKKIKQAVADLTRRFQNVNSYLGRAINFYGSISWPKKIIAGLVFSLGLFLIGVGFNILPITTVIFIACGIVSFLFQNHFNALTSKTAELVKNVLSLVDLLGETALLLHDETEGLKEQVTLLEQTALKINASANALGDQLAKMPAITASLTHITTAAGSELQSTVKTLSTTTASHHAGIVSLHEALGKLGTIERLVGVLTEDRRQLQAASSQYLIQVNAMLQGNEEAQKRFKDTVNQDLLQEVQALTAENKDLRTHTAALGAQVELLKGENDRYVAANDRYQALNDRNEQSILNRERSIKILHELSRTRALKPGDKLPSVGTTLGTTFSQGGKRIVSALGNEAPPQGAARNSLPTQRNPIM